ncbi:hypothetical protein CLOM_g11620 [Closterium sp. NIES-68]|nr:hypothetical protein CLOM_g11620 [Closterium sp. NIES-68]GJP58373.1 hypothetical protein CLOP_g23345 [Closterium sp. NIES-67]
MGPTQEYGNEDDALKAADVVLENLARQVEERIKEGPKSDLEPYLATIARLHDGVAFFEALREVKSVQAECLALAHSKRLLEEARPRLEGELRQQLLQFTKETEEEGGAGEREGEGLPVLLADGEAGERIRGVAEALIRMGRADNCRKIYTEVRSSMVEAGLRRMAAGRLTREEEVGGMVWEELSDCIEGWRRQTRRAVRVVLVAERQLCEAVLQGLEPHTGQAFADLAGATLGMLLGFGEAVARSSKPPEKVPALMDMYETMRDLMPQVRPLMPQVRPLMPQVRPLMPQVRPLMPQVRPLMPQVRPLMPQVRPLMLQVRLLMPQVRPLMPQVRLLMLQVRPLMPQVRPLMPQMEVVLGGAACAAIRANAQQLLQHLAAAAKEAFSNFELAVESEESSKMPPDGAAHTLTIYVVNYLRFLYEYKATMQELFSRDNFFSEATTCIFAALHANLERKSQLYRDAALTPLFLMNNVHRIVDCVQKTELKEVLGEDWIEQQRCMVQQHAASYQRTSWNKIFGLLAAQDGKEGSLSRGAVKERFCVFNATFEELHRSQCVWKIPDPELRSAVQLQIAEVLLPAYRSFVQRYTPVLESGGLFGRSSEAASKYIRFSNESLDSLLKEFFQGRESCNILLTQASADC